MEKKQWRQEIDAGGPRDQPEMTLKAKQRRNKVAGLSVK